MFGKMTLKSYLRILLSIMLIFFVLSILHTTIYFGAYLLKIHLRCIPIIYISLMILFLYFCYKAYLAHLFVNKNNAKTLTELEESIERYRKLLESFSTLYSKTLQHHNIKTQLICDISHDLKTPLSVILGSIQLMEQKVVHNNSEVLMTDSYNHRIKQNCYRLLRLVNNFLDITKMEAGFIKMNPTNCNIIYLVEEITLSIIPYAAQKNIIVEFDTEDEEIITAVDIDLIERILLNLLSNAIKFTNSEGKITVKTFKKEDNIIISVKDNGVGIPEDLKNSVFQRFKQVNNSLTKNNQGVGIGLSLVKSFVELHGGNIDVKTKLNEGSEFIIELPIKYHPSCNNEPHNLENSHSKIIETIKIEFSDIYTVAS